MRISMIILVLLFFSCSDKDVSPTYTSIEGSWEFFSASTSGDFVIKKDNSDFIVISGAFTMSNNSYTINTTTKVTTGYISLMGTDKSQLTLIKPVINSDYTEINCFGIEYGSNTIPTAYKNENVLIRRKL